MLPRAVTEAVPLSISVTTDPQSTVAATGKPQLPPGQPKYDEHFGDTHVFYDELEFDVPLTRSAPSAALLPVGLEFQGCKEDSICYPPQLLLLVVTSALTRSADVMTSRAPEASVSHTSGSVLTFTGGAAAGASSALALSS